MTIITDPKEGARIVAGAKIIGKSAGRGLITTTYQLSDGSIWIETGGKFPAYYSLVRKT